MKSISTSMGMAILSIVECIFSELRRPVFGTHASTPSSYSVLLIQHESSLPIEPPQRSLSFRYKLQLGHALPIP